MRGMAHMLSMAAALAIAAATAGCSGQPQLESKDELRTGDVILVGRIELVPPLFPNEQILGAPLTGRFRDKVHSLFSDQLYDPEESTFTFYRKSTLVELGREFYLRQPMSKTLFYSGGAVVMTATNQGQEDIKLPGGLRYTLNPGDRAVYVGTIRYHRDDYNTITKTEVIDDYARVNREFVARYGTGMKLRNVRPDEKNDR